MEISYANGIIKYIPSGLTKFETCLKDGYNRPIKIVFNEVVTDEYLYLVVLPTMKPFCRNVSSRLKY